ncbi:unnamed protein product [Calypogeia fissa]
MMPILLLVTILLGIFGAGGAAEKVCIVGSGIGGASTAFFLQKYSTKPIEIAIYERHDQVGGRLAQVQLGDDKFEAGGSIIANKNRHMRDFVELLGLTPNSDLGDDDFGIWDGKTIFFQTSKSGGSYISQKFTKIWNSLLLLWRYGMSLFQMDSYVSELMEKWDQLYSEEMLVYTRVEDMLKAVDLYEKTQITFEEDLISRGFSSRLINELITLIVRVNYGQNVSMHSLVGAVSLAGSGDELWQVKEGNWKVPQGLIKYTNSTLHLKEEIVSVTCNEGVYEVGLQSNQTDKCDAVVIATPLDEVEISFSPEVDIPGRSLQHTYTTFVRGLINAKYFGADSHENLPTLIGTVEDPLLLFSSISILKSYTDVEKAYKVFSRAPLTEANLDQLFKTRIQTLQLDWGAYPHYTAPETFAPILLDDNHLYYVNTFESAASAMEASAVAANNVARLLLSRMSGRILSCKAAQQQTHSEL